MKATLVAGLAYGDEGKGAAVDFLVRESGARLVVRYNGGAQAGHRVVMPDGREHVFAQFGSGTLAGARTFLSKHVVVNPISFLVEAKHLESLGLRTEGLVSVDREAALTTPFHVAANRLREIVRGNAKHGSCGVGVGETVVDRMKFGDFVPLVSDLEDPIRLRRKIVRLRNWKREEMKNLLETENFALRAEVPSSEWDASVREWNILMDEDVVEDAVYRFSLFAKHVRVVDGRWLRGAIRETDSVVFEGAQGVLLDQDVGFHPYTTWSDVTFRNAEALLQEAGFEGDVRKVGALRAYYTRHGAGPFPTEEGVCADANNVDGPWQGSPRVGDFDFVLMKYAIDAVGGVDEVHVSHLDSSTRQIAACLGYRADPTTEFFPCDSDRIQKVHESDLDRRARLSQELGRVTPITSFFLDVEMLVDTISEIVPVSVRGYGPTARDRFYRHSRKVIHGPA